MERRAYDGISTRELLDIVFEELAKVEPIFLEIVDLRSALGRLRSKPDFEVYARILLRSIGFKTKPNLMIKGKCLEYEVDGLAYSNGEVYIVEAKHHSNPHTYTKLEDVMAIFSKYMDIVEGFREGIHTINPAGVIIVCNTKFTEHAIRFAECKGIKLMAWRYPKSRGIEDIIRKGHLYPVSILKNLDNEEMYKLLDSGIILLMDLTKIDPSMSIGIPRCRIIQLKRKAKKVLDYLSSSPEISLRRSPELSL
mgnify:CR=1 FL=1